jgi:hypothetical protein
MTGGTLCGAILLMAATLSAVWAFVWGWVFLCSFWAAVSGVALIVVSTPFGSRRFESKNCSSE